MKGKPTVSHEEADTIRKEEIVEIYTALLDKIWQRSITILGLVTIRAIFQRAIYVTAQDYPLVGNLIVDETGLNIGGVRLHVGDRDKAIIRQGFEELILNLFSLLAELTGEAIVNKLFATDMPPIPHTEKGENDER